MGIPVAPLTYKRRENYERSRASHARKRGPGIEVGIMFLGSSFFPGIEVCIMRSSFPVFLFLSSSERHAWPNNEYQLLCKFITKCLLCQFVAQKI